MPSAADVSGGIIRPTMSNYRAILSRTVGLFALASLVLPTACGGGNATSAPTESKSGVPAKAQSAHLTFVPGERIGEYSLQQPTEALNEELGKATESDAAMGRALAVYQLPDGDAVATLTVGSTLNSPPDSTYYKVEFLRTTARKFHSASGLGVGSTRAEVEQEYTLTPVGYFTEGDVRYEVFDTDRGLGLELGQDNRVHGIIIHHPEKPAVEKGLPLYDEFTYSAEE